MRVFHHSPEAEVVKSCECGARYALRAWKRLRFRGLQEMDDEGELFLELRDCACCESTISLEVHLPAPAFAPAAASSALGSFGASP